MLSQGQDRPRLLDQSLLDDLEGRWRALGATVLQCLQPGLVDAEMDSLTAGLGIQLPAEAQMWWGWHNGATDRPGVGVDGTAIGPVMRFMPLDRAAELCRLLREELADEEPRVRWQDSWLPLCGDHDIVAIDCQAGVDESAPVYVLALEDPGPPDRVADSIGGLVEWFVGAMDCGAWVWLAAEKRWHYDREKLPPELQIVGLL